MASKLLHEGEQLIHSYRQTAWVLGKTILIVGIGIYLPWSRLAKYGEATQFRFLLVVWTLLLLVYGLRKLMIWLLNRYIVTNKRLIRITHQEIFKKIVVETPLERILNVSFKTTGFFSSIFHYGDVEVQVIGLI